MYATVHHSDDSPEGCLWPPGSLPNSEKPCFTHMALESVLALACPLMTRRATVKQASPSPAKLVFHFVDFKEKKRKTKSPDKANHIPPTAGASGHMAGRCVGTNWAAGMAGRVPVGGQK